MMKHSYSPFNAQQFFFNKTIVIYDYRCQKYNYNYDVYLTRVLLLPLSSLKKTLMDLRRFTTQPEGEMSR